LEVPNPTFLAQSFQIETVLKLGGLPIIKDLCDRLGLAQIVNDRRPLAPQALAGHGEILIALIMNKLTAPVPLYRVQEWAEESAVKPITGLNSELLNDDRIGRMLESIADDVEGLKTEICFAAIDNFGIDVGRLHWDLTSFEFEGNFDIQDAEFSALSYGYSTGGVGKRLQCRVGNLVSGDGAVGGLMHKVYSGNHCDQNSIGDYFELLKQIYERYGKRPKIIGDSKLCGHELMAKLHEADLQFITPEFTSKRLKSVCVGCREGEFGEGFEFDYTPERDLRVRPEVREWYHGWESEYTLRIDEPEEGVYSKGDLLAKRPHSKSQKRLYRFRRIVVLSSGKQASLRKTRTQNCAKLEAKLLELDTKFQTPWWMNKGKERVQKAVNQILQKTKVREFYRVTLAPRDEGGWAVSWELDEEALRTIEKADGFYALVTNIPIEEATASEVFCDYKRQNDAERRFADWKHPNRVCPMFLKSNKRITGLIFVLAISLLILCLLEREVRNRLPEGKMEGLLPVKRATRATGWNILKALEGLTLIGIRVGPRLIWQCSPPNPTQTKLFKLIKTDFEIALNKGSPK
jgi:transposase